MVYAPPIVTVKQLQRRTGERVNGGLVDLHDVRSFIACWNTKAVLLFTACALAAKRSLAPAHAGRARLAFGVSADKHAVLVAAAGGLVKNSLVNAVFQDFAVYPSAFEILQGRFSVLIGHRQRKRPAFMLRGRSALALLKRNRRQVLQFTQVPHSADEIHPLYLDEIVQRPSSAYAMGKPVPQPVVADAQAAVRGGFVVVRAGADQFLRFVLLHVAYQIYTFCQSDLLFGYSLAHDDSSFSASSVSASRGVWGEYGCGTFPQIGTLPPFVLLE